MCIGFKLCSETNFFTFIIHISLVETSLHFIYRLGCYVTNRWPNICIFQEILRPHYNVTLLTTIHCTFRSWNSSLKYDTTLPLNVSQSATCLFSFLSRNKHKEQWKDSSKELQLYWEVLMTTNVAKLGKKLAMKIDSSILNPTKTSLR